MKQRTYSQHMKKQQGFTLLELLVVVSVLATLAGITAVAMDGYEQDAQEQLVNTEMKRIASAIYRFKEDTGYFPKEGIFAGDALFGADSGDEKIDYNKIENLEWLFVSPKVFDTNDDDKVDGSDSAPFERLAWDVNRSRGWNGPYIEPSSQSHVIDNVTVCGLSEANFDTGFDDKQSAGLTDAFERNTLGMESCAAVHYSGEWVRREFTGQAYRYFTEYKNDAITDCSQSGNGCIALVSSGKDGVLDTNLTDAVTNDIVHILRVNL